MNRNEKYDLLIIGGGISGSVFASDYIKKKPTHKIALIEAGRNLGGRSSTRISRRFKEFEINHGAPNFNISNLNRNDLLKNFIQELLDDKFIRSDNSELIEEVNSDDFDKGMKSEFLYGKNYISSSSMSNLSHQIIEKNNLRDQIDFYFETLILNLEFHNNYWILSSIDGDIFKSKYLVFASNLLLHKRSFEILNVNQIPLRQAVPRNKNKKIDSLLKTLEKQYFLPRLSFLIYTNSNYEFKDAYFKKYRYLFLNNDLENKYKFERIIFQNHRGNKLSIVIHSRSIDLINDYNKSEKLYIFKQNIIRNFNEIFNQNKFINKLSGSENISIMKWRGSQPYGEAVPSSLQFCSQYNIGFCGDWFDEIGFGRIEGAILSALKLGIIFRDLN